MDFVLDSEHSMRASVARPKTAIECVMLQDKTVGNKTTIIGPFKVDYELSTHQVAILSKMVNFYSPDLIEEVLRPSLSHGADSSNPSLRVLDWLTVNYAKKHKLCTHLPDGRVFNVYQGYRVSLQMYRRRLFDPFRRRLRLICMSVNGDLESTIGQLQFLAWAYTNGVLQYAREHASTIEADMNVATLRSRQVRGAAAARGIKCKRNELSRACATKVTVYPNAERMKW